MSIIINPAKEHKRKPPGWFSRKFHRYKHGTQWQCTCETVYELRIVTYWDWSETGWVQIDD